MATNENSFQRDPFPSLYHRILGRRCYMIDIDAMITTDTVLDNLFTEYRTDGHKRHVCAIIDYKRIDNPANQTIRLDVEPILAQQSIADFEYKYPVPFFVVLSYLSDTWKDKMYRVLPFNSCAMNDYVQFAGGVWMSLRQYSKFLHHIRHITFNPEELINEDIRAKLNIPARTLGELPDVRAVYPLPHIIF